MHQRRPNMSQARQALVEQAKRYVAAHLGERAGVADVASSVGVPPAYLAQAFREIEGVPLYRYELRLRLSRALELLPRYDDIAKLALDLGFSSHSHFTTAFRRSFGCPPHCQRERLRGQEHAPCRVACSVARVVPNGHRDVRLPSP